MTDPSVSLSRPDQDGFVQMAERHRHELEVHCYRMLGSLQDAQDAVQETYLRAWTRLDTYAGRSTFRAWLYGIATHVCLDALRRRKSRVWISDLAGPADPKAEPAPFADLPWLQPYPDRLLEPPAPADGEPEAVVTAKETIELAFLAAIQQLTARQRAVLILRDVLDWSARNTAAALDMTETAVHSALRRARGTLGSQLPKSRTEWRGEPTPTERGLLRDFIAAWERTDTSALVELLRADARFVMPPRPTWFLGRDTIGTFLDGHVFAVMGTDWRLLPTSANGQPAFGLYWRSADSGDHRPFAIGVLREERGGIGEIGMFLQPELFAAFGLPEAVR
ncbi:RNA polymerase subunit sigma-70 [Streptomyces sp. CA-111067]|uniref:RNA polymerase subunit sigma-70 n=1 Tax=Streptomyces sp. CA-111067 TaxID=3240046 RepID=UPI003D967B57